MPTTERLAEYRNKTITHIFRGNRYYGTYFLAFLIFTFGMIRDSLRVSLTPYSLSSRSNRLNFNSYTKALLDQPQIQLLPAPFDTIVPAILFIMGQTLVISSTYALGITGTFLGDYFGILMDARVEGRVSGFHSEIS